MLALGLFQGIGVVEIAIVAIAVLLLFGSGKIADFARSLGRAKGEFARGSDQVEREREEERLRNQARDLGIDPAGKTVAQLRAEIAARKAS